MESITRMIIRYRHSTPLRIVRLWVVAWIGALLGLGVARAGEGSLWIIPGTPPPGTPESVGITGQQFADSPSLEQQLSEGPLLEVVQRYIRELEDGRWSQPLTPRDMRQHLNTLIVEAGDEDYPEGQWTTRTADRLGVRSSEVVPGIGAILNDPKRFGILFQTVIANLSPPEISLLAATGRELPVNGVSHLGTSLTITVTSDRTAEDLAVANERRSTSFSTLPHEFIITPREGTPSGSIGETVVTTDLTKVFSGVEFRTFRVYSNSERADTTEFIHSFWTADQRTHGLSQVFVIKSPGRAPEPSNADSSALFIGLEYQYGPTGETEQTRARAGIATSPPPGVDLDAFIESVIADVEQNGDRALAIQQALQLVVIERENAVQSIFLDGMYVTIPSTGRILRKRFPIFSEDVVIYDRQDLRLNDGTIAFEFVRRNSGGAVKLFNINGGG